jgi:hypothetical protein
MTRLLRLTMRNSGARSVMNVGDEGTPKRFDCCASFMMPTASASVASIV